MALRFGSKFRPSVSLSLKGYGNWNRFFRRLRDSQRQLSSQSQCDFIVKPITRGGMDLEFPTRKVFRRSFLPCWDNLPGKYAPAPARSNAEIFGRISVLCVPVPKRGGAERDFGYWRAKNKQSFITTVIKRKRVRRDDAFVSNVRKRLVYVLHKNY